MNTAKKMTTTELGRQAEQIVYRYFEDLDAVILEQNLRVKKYEIDLIIELKGLLVVVEVKMRGSNQFGRPREHLHSDQFYRIISAYEWWARGKKFWCREVRFDLIEYYPQDNRLVHLEDAFRPKLLLVAIS